MKHEKGELITSLLQSQGTDHEAIKNEIILSLQKFLTQRFDLDKNVVEVLKPFAGLKSELT